MLQIMKREIRKIIKILRQRGILPTIFEEKKDNNKDIEIKTNVANNNVANQGGKNERV